MFCGFFLDSTQCIFAQELDNDSSIMRPGAIHAVVTLDTCVATGQHFYSFETLELTFRSLVNEHFMGKSITNTEHIYSLLLLFKAVDSLAADLPLLLEVDRGTPFHHLLELSY